MRRLLLALMITTLVLAGCGDDDDAGSGDTDSGDETPGSTDDGSDDTSGDTSADDTADGGDVAAPAGDPTGTVTIDGTEYTVVADLQCLVAIEQVNQISISGSLDGVDSGSPVDFAYSYDSDDGINEFHIDVSAEEEYRTFDGLADFDEPQVDGSRVSVSGMLNSPTAGAVPASFEIDCG